ncbi:MAG: GNAT family N-acetyltransferase [Planctomycetales bacterium]
MVLREVTTWHYEMTSPDQFHPSQRKTPGLEFRQSKICLPSFGLFLNNAVGANYNWVLRRSWTAEQWHEFWDRPELQVWVAWLQGTPAGFFELEFQPGQSVEIVKFGIVPEFVGQGLGGEMLTFALQHAWQSKAKRVWLHTCSLDHPTARAHYEARGFRLFNQETTTKDIQPPQGV